jgi:hypothetical protein
LAVILSLTRGKALPSHSLSLSKDALYEYACHEGNLKGILSGARAQEVAEKASKSGLR